MLNSNCQKMPALETAAFVGGGLDLIKQKKLQKASAGTKVYTMPKTAVGKLIGGISGRTEAAKISSTMDKESTLSPKATANLIQQGKVPITGGLSFGGEAARKTYFPFALIAGVVAIFFFMRNRRGGRRRR
jgi:hypothetical protein